MNNRDGRVFFLGNADLAIHDQKHDRQYRLREINEKLEAKKKELELRGLYNNSTEPPDIKMTGFSGSSRRGEPRRGGVSRRTRKFINRKKNTKKRRGRFFSKKNRSANANNKTR